MMADRRARFETLQREDAAAIEAILAEQAEALNRGDAKGYAERFAANGTYTNLLGMVFHGRDACEQRIAEVLGGFAKGSKTKMTLRILRFIRPDVAIANMFAEVTGYRLMPPGTPMSPDGAVRCVHQVVFVREEGEWWITAFHSVPVVSPVLPREMVV